MKQDFPTQEYMQSGHLACPGCGAPLAMRYVMKALGRNTIIVIPACCWSIIDGPFPYSSTKVPVIHMAFEAAAAAASGIRAALDAKGDKKTTVMAWAGDGGTFDIGLQALSGAAERNEDFIYVCYDNEAYMNTGIQRSSSTPYGAWTTTTPVRHYKKRPKKDLMQIMAAHQIPYCATANVAFPDDLIEKVRKAKKFKGTRLLHIFSPCPPGWKMYEYLSIKAARMAVTSNMFPLYEIYDGRTYRINYIPKETTPVEEYMSLQGRFSHLKPKDIREIAVEAQRRWRDLVARSAS